MKVILSRKGFDSSSGGKPSPIINDRMVSLPIPEAWSGVNYDSLQFRQADNSKEICCRQLMQNLGIQQFSECHLDPDIRESIFKTPHIHWKPAFGQLNNSASELENLNVEQGDLFLFFSTFSPAIFNGERYEYVDIKDEFHAIWGYLEVDEVIALHNKERPIGKGYDHHPHMMYETNREKEYPRFEIKKNLLYTAKEKSSIMPSKPGYGMFNWNEKALRLSAKNKTKSFWKKRNCLKPLNRIKNSSGNVWHSGGRGQEFIFEIQEQAEWKKWIRQLTSLVER